MRGATIRGSFDIAGDDEMTKRGERILPPCLSPFPISEYTTFETFLFSKTEDKQKYRKRSENVGPVSSYLVLDCLPK